MSGGHRSLMVEHLESRRLLAADLVVEHDAFLPASPGEEVARVIRVHNLGDEVAEQTLIRSSLTNELNDPSWVRQVGRAKFVTTPRVEPDLELVSTAADGTRWRVTELKSIGGDLNGDGLDDFILHRQAFRSDPSLPPAFSHIRRWVTENPVVAFSAIDENFDVANATALLEIELDDRGRSQFASIGDINGDGFDELTVDGKIIFGRNDLAGDTIDITHLKAGEVVDFRDVRSIHPIGDLNQDGYDDVVGEETSRIVFGSADFGSESTTVDHSQLGDGRLVDIACNGIPDCERLSSSFDPIVFGASPIGDFNGDGVDDAVVGIANIGTLVLYGGEGWTERGSVNAVELGQNGFRIPIENQRHFGFDVRFRFRAQDIHYNAGADFDNDGFSDLLITMQGGGNEGSTATDRSNMDAFGGVVVVFGGPNVAVDGQFNTQHARTMHFDVAVTSFGERPETVIRDVNDDGRDDFVLHANRSYAILDVNQISSLDFGYGESFDSGETAKLNGENGFAAPRNSTFLDVNRDGLVDELRFGRENGVVFLGGPPSDPVEGVGNIDEVLDIEPGTSLVFTVRGVVRDDPGEFETTASNVELESELRDNVVSSRDAVSLETTISGPENVKEGEVAEFQIRVSNKGPTTATNLRFTETLASQLTNPSWSRTDRLFPPILKLEQLNGADGASFSGPTRAYTERQVLPNYTGPYLFGLGTQVASLGDVDGDGFDDIVGLSERDGLDLTPGRAVEFRGGPNFGADGEFPPIATHTQATLQPRARFAVGDFNGDGFPDALESDAQANESRGEAYVTFGSANGVPDVPLVELDGSNGFKLVGELPGDYAGRSVAFGDINADGFDDVLISRGAEGWDPESPPYAAYVVYGHTNPTSEISLGSLDGSNGFMMETKGPVNSVASNFDVNGDGIDDILVGDTGGGIEMNLSNQRHGELHVVFGRQAMEESSGTDSIDELLTIPVGGEVTFTIRGTTAKQSGGHLRFEATALAADDQIDIANRFHEVFGSNTTARLGFPQTPELIGIVAQCGGMHVRSDGETQVGYFSANGGLFGCGGRLDYEGIWRTDGTPEGTWAIGEALGEYPRTETMVEHEGYFYFLVSSNGEGWDDVYRSDGTPDSTTMVGSYLELRPKQPIVTLGSQLIHWDWESSFSSRANRLVATQGGTTQVLLDGGTVQFDRSDEANFRDLRRVGDGVYFGGSHLYRTDGTAAGTDVVRQATRVSFTNQVSPTQQHFWDDTTDGYRLGVISHTTTQLIDHPQLVFEGGSPPLFGTHVWNDSLILRGANDSLLRVSNAEVTELAQGTGRIDFVQEWNGQLVVQAGGRLIVSDGTADGTRQIYSGEIANDRFGRLQVRTTARHLYFAVEQGIFRSNGTLAGTELIETGGKPTIQIAADNFVAWQVGERSDVGGEETWMLAVDEFQPVRFAERTGIEPRWGLGFHLRMDDGLALVSGKRAGDVTDRFYRTDGTAEGTTLFANFQAPYINPGFTSSYDPIRLDGNGGFLKINDRYIYSAHHLGPPAMYTIETETPPEPKRVADVLKSSSKFGDVAASTDVDLADLDGDGDLDMLETVTGQPSQVWLNDGGGNFSRGPSLTAAHESIYSALGDLDGDGDVDAAIATYDLGTVLAFNDGNGELTLDYRIAGEPVELHPSPVPYRNHDIALGDLDGDNDLDIFVAAFSAVDFEPLAEPSRNRVWLNDGFGNFIEVENDDVPKDFSTSVELGDVDGDGDLDAVTSARTDPGSRVLLNDGNGRFADSGQLLNPAEHHTLFDADGDGDLDLVAAENGANRLFLNDGEGNFTRAVRLGGSRTSHIVAADFDSDGDTDLLAANWRGDGNEVWLNDGSGGFHLQNSLLDEDAGTDHVAVGDIDGDGDLDAVAAIFRGSNRIYENTLSVLPIDGDVDGNGSVNFLDFLVIANNFGSTDADRERGDLTGDGKVDFFDFLQLANNFGRS